MGRGQNTIDDLFYGTQLGPRIEPLDSLDPSADTMSWVKELLADAKRGKWDSAVYALEMIGQPKGDIAQYPALNALFIGLADMQVKKFLRREKLKLKVAGAKAEQKDILAQLVNDMADRFWAPQEINPDTGEPLPLPEPQDRMSVDNNDFVIAALGNESDPSPIADQYRERISATNITQLDENLLRAALSPDASDKTKEAVEGALNRTIVSDANELANRFGLHAEVSSFDTPYGIARASYKGSSVLHLRKPDYRWESICGKRITRSARFGAWSDASTGADYRRCKDCEKGATAKLIEEAEEQQAGSGSNYFPPAEAKQIAKISEDSDVQEVVRKWAQSKDDIDSLSEGIDKVASEKLAPILADTIDSPKTSSTYGHPLMAMLPSPLRNKLQGAGLWDYSEDNQVMRERLLDMLPEDVRRETVRIIATSGSANTYYSYHSESGKKMLEYLEPYVDDYIAKNGKQSGN